MCRKKFGEVTVYLNEQKAPITIFDPRRYDIMFTYEFMVPKIYSNPSDQLSVAGIVNLWRQNHSLS